MMMMARRRRDDDSDRRSVLWMDLLFYAICALFVILLGVLIYMRG
jgi:hypothetical protein